MSANYTHYRFGRIMLEAMPQEIAQLVQKNRQLYDLGLHGPDIFLYTPWVRRDKRRLGKIFHKQSGQEFFGRACENIRRQSDELFEAAQAYLYGFLCHYALDSVFHPYICAHSTTGGEHWNMEMELDRHLLILDGNPQPQIVDFSGHIRVSRKDCRVLKLFFPGTSTIVLRHCTWVMHTCQHMLSYPEGKRKQLVEWFLHKCGPTPESVIMRREPNPTCHHLLPMFMDFYRTAEENYQKFLPQLREHLLQNVPLGPDFIPDFG